jgi:hypothetical protein
LLDYSAAVFNGILLARGSSPMLEEQTDQIVFVRKAKTESISAIRHEPECQWPVGAADQHSPNFGEPVFHLADFGGFCAHDYRRPPAGQIMAKIKATRQ